MSTLTSNSIQASILMIKNNDLLNLTESAKFYTRVLFAIPNGFKRVIGGNPCDAANASW
jgi:hypothetical protein